MCFASGKSNVDRLDAVATKKRRSEENVSVAALTCSPSCYEMKSIFLGFVFRTPEPGKIWKRTDTTTFFTQPGLASAQASLTNLKDVLGE